MTATLDALDRFASGEACVVSFSYAQTGNLGFAFIGLGGVAEIRRENRSVAARRPVLQAWRIGRRRSIRPCRARCGRG